MGTFYWARLARAVLPRDPLHVARAALRAVREEDLAFHDERLSVLAEALHADPTRVWPEVGALLLEDSGAALTLRWWAQEASPLEAVNPDLLLAWAAGGQGEERAMRLAQLVKPRDPLTPLVRALLARYGARSGVGRVLAANFSSGFWSGSYAAREGERRNTAVGWLSDPEPEVQAWAAENIASIDQELPTLELQEAEERLYS